MFDSGLVIYDKSVEFFLDNNAIFNFSVTFGVLFETGLKNQVDLMINGFDIEQLKPKKETFEMIRQRNVISYIYNYLKVPIFDSRQMKETNQVMGMLKCQEEEDETIELELHMKRLKTTMINRKNP